MTVKVPWEAINAARVEMSTAVAALLDLTGPAGYGYIRNAAESYIETRLAMMRDEDCDCDEDNDERPAS